MPDGLSVSGRAVARFWSVPEEVPDVVAAAGLLARREGGFDAAAALALGRRAWVTDAELANFSPGALLVVQQGPVVPVARDDPDLSWRACYGWSPQLSQQEALLSAAGWWQLKSQRRANAQALVSVVGTFVVTVAVIDPDRPVAGRQSGGYVRLNLAPLSGRDDVGARLLRSLAGRRIPRRRGTPAFPLPDPEVSVDQLVAAGRARAGSG
jgi:hypothetical protein